MIEQLKKNVETEIAMLREISNHVKLFDYSSEEEQKLIRGAINSLISSIRIINNSLPGMLNDITGLKKLPVRKKVEKNKLEEVNYQGAGPAVNVSLASKDKRQFLTELRISENYIKRIKKKSKDKLEKAESFQVSRGYLKLANKMFLGQASEWARRGRFKDLALALRKAHMNILFESYVAMMFFTTFLSIILGFVIYVASIFIDFSFTSPMISLFRGNYLLRIFQQLWIPILLPVLTFGAIYYYPTTERKSLSRGIDQELPFAVIHMSAISGSGIEPSEIFKIIALNKEYPHLRKEIRKVINQVNLYGYDLVTALNNAARTSPSQRLADLLSGLSATITSGSDLSNFFEKRAETLLLNYRLEREGYTKTIETFLDIYISVVIAAPMIFLLLFVLLMISGVDIGITPGQIGILAVVGIALLNIVFLVFLQIKQPSY